MGQKSVGVYCLLWVFCLLKLNSESDLIVSSTRMLQKWILSYTIQFGVNSMHRRFYFCLFAAWVFHSCVGRVMLNKAVCKVR